MPRTCTLRDLQNLNTHGPCLSLRSMTATQVSSKRGIMNFPPWLRMALTIRIDPCALASETLVKPALSCRKTMKRLIFARESRKFGKAGRSQRARYKEKHAVRFLLEWQGQRGYGVWSTSNA